MNLENAKIIIDKLANAGIQKITFAGGEPFRYRHIKEIIKYTHSKGIITSIITNGSLVTMTDLRKLRPYLKWFGVSIDSFDPKTNEKIGRIGNRRLTVHDLLENIAYLDYTLKINTVVNAYNWSEDMNESLADYKPERWKVFQALRVQGQNDKNEIKCSKEQFNHFIKNHQRMNPIIEDNSKMIGSYLLIDPLGRMFENSEGKHSYSKSLIEGDFQELYDSLDFDYDNFIKEVNTNINEKFKRECEET